MCNFCKLPECLSKTDCAVLKAVVCYKCKGMGHTPKTCAKMMPDILPNCNFCKQDGHTMKDCEAFSKVKCLKCGAVGKHTTKFCAVQGEQKPKSEPFQMVVEQFPSVSGQVKSSTSSWNWKQAVKQREQEEAKKAEMKIKEEKEKEEKEKEKEKEEKDKEEKYKKMFSELESETTKSWADDE